MYDNIIKTYELEHIRNKLPIVLCIDEVHIK